MANDRHKVVVIGGGFGGLNVARALAKAPVDVTIADRTNHHLFQPLLYQVAAGIMPPGLIAPALRSVIALNPDAEAQAKALDAERKAGRIRGPLHGVPVLIKDNVETADPMPTTAGSLALAANLTRRDAPVVAGLRAAGAVILGKTNLSEWANIRSTRSISGWSGVGGQVRNPYALDRTACGSSSGSGAATAAASIAALSAVAGTRIAPRVLPLTCSTSSISSR